MVIVASPDSITVTFSSSGSSTGAAPPLFSIVIEVVTVASPLTSAFLIEIPTSKLTVPVTVGVPLIVFVSADNVSHEGLLLMLHT